MKSLSKYSLDDGSYIFIEAEEPQGIALASREGTGVQSKVIMGFREELDKVMPVANVIITKFRDLSSKPDEVQLQFGLKMSATAGAIITSGAIEANFNVTLKWTME